MGLKACLCDAVGSQTAAFVPWLASSHASARPAARSVNVQDPQEKTLALDSPTSARQPVFNVPTVVTVLLALLLLVHLARLTLSDADDDWVILLLAFIPDRYASHALAWPGGMASAVLSPVTHMLVHGDWPHLVLNSASLLIFGGMLSRRLGTVRFLAFTVFAGLAGAALFFAFNVGLKSPMIGASGAIAGMMAGALRLMFSAIDGAPRGRAGETIRSAPGLIHLKSLAATLADRRVQSTTALWLAINALGAFGLATPGHVGTVAWEAHIGGYFAGLLGLGLFDPPPAHANDNRPGPDDPVANSRGTVA